MPNRMQIFTASHPCLSGELLPPDRLVAFFAEAAVDDLLIGWLGWLGSEQPLQERGHEAPDCPTHCACCGARTCMPHNCAAGTARGRAYDTTCRGSGDHTFLGCIPAFG